MAVDSIRLSTQRKSGASKLRNSFGVSSCSFEGNTSKNSYSGNQLDLLIRLLEASGLRISEALKLTEYNFVDTGVIEVSTHKKGNSRTFNIPIGLYVLLKVRAVQYGKCFDLKYHYVYKALKKMSFENTFIKNKKNFAITHFFRKKLIRKMFYEYKNPIPFILDFFGWKSKKSLLYYL